MPAKRVDIFKLLGTLSKKSTKFYDDLSVEDKKTVAPLIVMRWLTGTDSQRQVYFLNELVNPFIFSLYKHPDLLMKLMTVCTSRPQRYNWVKPISKKTTSTPMAVRVLHKQYGYNTLDAIDALPLLSDSVIIAYAEDQGFQTDEIKKLKAELKKR